MNHIERHRQQIASQIYSTYNNDNGIAELAKAEVMDIQKGGKAAMIGTTKNWGGKEYIKTAEGWRPKTGPQSTRVEEHKKNNPSHAYDDAALAKHAQGASQEALQKHVKESRDPKMRTAAHNELKRREAEEAGKTDKTKKPAAEKPEVKEKKTKEVDPEKVQAKEEWNKRNSWWQEYKQHNLSAYPVDVPQKDVKVNLEGDINSHAVLTWKDPKSGAIKNAYTKEFLDRNAAVKWERTSAITKEHMNAIKTGANAMLDSKDPKIANAAAIISIIADTGLRRGDPVKFEKTGNRGVMTLAPDSVTINGDTVSFSFTGKSYKHNTAEVTDPALAKYIGKLQKERKGEKFLFNTTDSAIDSTFDHVGGDGLKIKDMRTYAACDLARKLLFEDKGAPPPIPEGLTTKQKQALVQNKLKNVYEQVSEKLNNTPAMAKTAYIHPNIVDSWIASLNADFEIKKSEDAEKESSIPTLDDIIAEYLPVKHFGKIDDEDEELCDEYNQPDYLPELTDDTEEEKE